MVRPLVSVVLASFNESPEIISASIGSILKQTYRDFELLIFDDSTKEGTKAAVDLFKADSRVKVFRGQGRKGFVHSLNDGLKMARGKYIARMDGDDIALPERLEKEVSFLEAHNEIYVVGGQINLIDGAGKVVSSRSYPLGGWKLWLFSTIRNPLAHPAVMMRKELVEKGFYYDAGLKMSEDLDLWLRVLNAGYRIANIPDTVLDYRVDNDFIKKRSSQSQSAYMAGVRKKNFDRRHFFHSFLSCLAGQIFKIAPSEIIKKIYQKENGQRDWGGR